MKRQNPVTKYILVSIMFILPLRLMHPEIIEVKSYDGYSGTMVTTLYFIHEIGPTPGDVNAGDAGGSNDTASCGICSCSGSGCSCRSQAVSIVEDAAISETVSAVTVAGVEKAETDAQESVVELADASEAQQDGDPVRLTSGEYFLEDRDLAFTRLYSGRFSAGSSFGPLWFFSGDARLVRGTSACRRKRGKHAPECLSRASCHQGRDDLGVRGSSLHRDH